MRDRFGIRHLSALCVRALLDASHCHLLPYAIFCLALARAVSGFSLKHSLQNLPLEASDLGVRPGATAEDRL